jgi:hypothetical protein
MDSSQVGVFEQGDEVGLRSLLERHHRRRLEAQVSLEVLGYENMSEMIQFHLA